MKTFRFKHLLLGLGIFANPFGQAPAPAPVAKSATASIYGVNYDAMRGVAKWGNYVVNDIGENDFMQYSQVDFGNGSNIWFGASVSVAEGWQNKSIELHIDRVDGPVIGTLKIATTGTWSTFVPQWTKVIPTTGVHELFLVGRGGPAIANLYAFLFAPQPGPSSDPAPAPVNTGTIPKPGSLTGLTESGPITLESGRTYSGLRITNPNGPCVTGRNVKDVRITKSEIGPCGNGTDPESAGVSVYDASNIRVDHNIIHDAARGFNPVRSTGAVFDYNYVYGIRGPMPAGQIAQYDRAYGPGNKVLCNIGANTDKEGVEDSVNLWMSSGTSASYIEVAYNRIRGGHSKTGSGIILGDGEGSAYIDVHDNTIVNANNAGIGVAGGTNMKVRNNRVYNNGAYTALGISVRNFYSVCNAIEVTNNRVWAFDRVWNSSPTEWHLLNTGECSGLIESGNTFGDLTLSTGMFDEVDSHCTE